MKETHYKLKHRVTALFAAAVMLCSMLPGAAFAEEPTPQPTEETAQMEQQTEPSETDNGQTDESSPDPGEDVTEATPEAAEEQPAEEEIPAAVVGAELYTDLPNAPIGSYIGSEGLPVATGETKIGISEWPESQLEETSGSYLTAAALDNDGLTMAAPLLDGADYAIVPIMVQVEYPADGSTLDLVLPDSVTLLDYYGAPAADAESLLHSEYSETSAAVLGVYVQADANFTAQLVYTAPDGSTLTKTLNVTIDRNATAEYPFPDSEIAAFAERPTPAVTSGKITKVAKVNGTWLIWFNGEPAYCCTPGADGQPKNCPTYTYVNTSMVGADQYVPGDHYGNQYRIWGGLTQLSLGMQELPPVALSAEAPSLLDSCRTIYTDAQMQIIENYPDSTAAKILIGSAQTLLEGTDAYASARGYYTYIYQPGRAGWQTVAVIGPEISDDEPNPKPIVQEIYANWEAPAQTASGSFDFDYGIIFESDSDCEIILPLYYKYGLDMFNHLDAEFAMILYDSRKKWLIAARDPIGIRPLFYGYSESGHIAFASEAKNLIGLCKKIYPFPIGSYYCNGKFVRYCDIADTPAYNIDDMDTTLTKIREKLVAGVDKRLDADTPVGFLLSGGLDSSLVCAIAAKKLGKPIRTFAIGMSEDAIDLKYAKQVADYLHADHTEVIINKEIVLNALEEVIAMLGTWDITTIRASVGMYLVCKYIHEHTDIRVLLTGEISDELFGYKYTDFAPSAHEFQAESQKRIRELFMYDVLRADRSISVNSLEARVPFGDLDFVKYVMSIDPARKMNIYNKGKYLLRKAFEGDWLPESILWREKAAFSDAVGHSMVDDIKEYAESYYTDREFAEKSGKYAYCRPFTKESLLYREIFEKYYPGQAEMIVDYWMPNKAWPNCAVNDPSARVLKNYGDSGK